MVISTKVYVEHPDLALSHTIRTLPDLDVGVVPDVGTDPDHDVYYFWAETEDFDAVDRALAEDHTVEEFSLVAETDARRTYRIEYADGTKLISPPVTEHGGITLDSRSHSKGWVLDLQLPDHAALYALNEYATEEGIRVDILGLQHSGGGNDSLDFGLTESQREALVGAFVHGYYDEPRETSLEGLASLLGISPTAVSGRLRRGSARLIEEVLIDEERD